MELIIAKINGIVLYSATALFQLLYIITQKQITFALATAFTCLGIIHLIIRIRIALLELKNKKNDVGQDQ
jgi:hypothetical protein